MKCVMRSGLAMLVLLVVSGCLSIKTQHEIKPIQISLDINLKIDRELDDFLELKK